MDQVAEYLGARLGQQRISVVFLDAGFAETLKWHGQAHADPGLLVLPLSADSPSGEQAVDGWMKLHKPLWGIFFISTPLRAALPAIQRHVALLALPECVVMTTSTPESTVLPDQGPDLDEPYAFAVNALLPSHATIIYFPLHVVPILFPPPPPVSSQPTSNCGSAATQPWLQVFALASPGCRTLFPATLGTLRTQSQSQSLPQSVHHLGTSDLPFSAKAQLRTLAHELSCALVNELGLDCAEHIFTLGQTSGFVGHSMQPIVSGLLQRRKEAVLCEMDREQGLQVGSADLNSGGTDFLEVAHLASRLRDWPSSERHKSQEDAEGYSLESDTTQAALLLIDRTEDLFSPTSHGASAASPLAHRVLCALGRQVDLRPTAAATGAAETYPLCDVGVSSALQAETFALTQTGACDIAWADRPFGAVAGLSIDVASSICPQHVRGPHEATGSQQPPSPSLTVLPALHRLLVSGSEEDLRTALVAALKAAIAHHGGSMPPPKKRGTGAEVLALVQSLLAAPGAGAGAGSAARPSVRVCLDEQPLLTLAATVIEAMQRSASKPSAPAPSAPSPPSVPSTQVHHGVLAGWQASFDVRGARERALEDLLQPSMASFAECVPFLVSFLQAPLAAAASASASQAPPAQARARLEDPCAGPADVSHLLLQAVRALSLLGLQGYLLHPQGDRFPRAGEGLESGAGADVWAPLRRDVALLTAAMGDFLLTHCPAGELRHLGACGVLPDPLAVALAESRLPQSAAALKCQEGEDDGWGDDFDAVPAASAGPTSSGPHGVEARLQAVMDDWAERLVEMGTGLRSGCAADGRPTELVDLLSSVKAGAQAGGELAGQRADRVQGVVARSLAMLLRHSRLDPPPAFPSFQRVESPLQQIKRAGLGLLSSGLSLAGRWGLSLGAAAAPAEPTPAGQRVLVVFVVGGLSCREVGQVQGVLDDWARAGGEGVRVVLGGNRVVTGDDVVRELFAAPC